MPKLIHSYKGQTVKQLDLQPGTMTIGRHPDCYIQLADDVTVSGLHAQVIVSANDYMDDLMDIRIEDQNSTNGVKVNGKRVKSHLLKHGDCIKIGEHEFMYVDENNRSFEKTQVVITKG